MKQRTAGNIIAGRCWTSTPPCFFYVSEVPGDGGKDWGYTRERGKALPLNRYFARRFVADCDRVGIGALTWYVAI